MIESKGSFRGRVGISNGSFDPSIASNVQSRTSEDSRVRTFDNQITYLGAQSLLKTLQTQSSAMITNLFLLNNFTLPSGVTDKEVTFDMISNYIAPQGFVGNNNIVNPDKSRDFRAYVNSTEPYELTIIGYFPIDRANIDPTFNAAALIIGGDEFQSTSSSEIETHYVNKGTEILFSLVQFPPITKDSLMPFTVVWNILLDV